MCTVDFDPPTVQHTAVRTAVKDHKCCECSRTITPGDMYRIDKALFDGRWSVWKTCLGCVRLRERLLAQMELGKIPPNQYADECGSWFFEMLKEALEEGLKEWCAENWRCVLHWECPTAEDNEHDDCKAVDFTLADYSMWLGYVEQLSKPAPPNKNSASTKNHPR